MQGMGFYGNQIQHSNSQWFICWKRNPFTNRMAKSKWANYAVCKSRFLCKFGAMSMLESRTQETLYVEVLLSDLRCWWLIFCVRYSIFDLYKCKRQFTGTEPQLKMSLVAVERVNKYVKLARTTWHGSWTVPAMTLWTKWTIWTIRLKRIVHIKTWYTLIHGIWVIFWVILQYSKVIIYESWTMSHEFWKFWKPY